MPSSKYDMAAQCPCKPQYDYRRHDMATFSNTVGKWREQSRRVAAVVEAATAVYIHKQRGVVHPGATGVGMYDDKLSKLERDLERAVLELDMGGESYISRYALPVTGEDENDD